MAGTYRSAGTAKPAGRGRLPPGVSAQASEHSELLPAALPTAAPSPTAPIGAVSAATRSGMPRCGVIAAATAAEARL